MIDDPQAGCFAFVELQIDGLLLPLGSPCFPGWDKSVSGGRHGKLARFVRTDELARLARRKMIVAILVRLRSRELTSLVPKEQSYCGPDSRFAVGGRDDSFHGDSRRDTRGTGLILTRRNAPAALLASIADADRTHCQQDANAGNYSTAASQRRPEDPPSQGFQPPAHV